MLQSWIRNHSRYGREHVQYRFASVYRGSVWDLIAPVVGRYNDMSGVSKIEWTDATWNPVRGCSKISPGCAHCYAETFAERLRGVAGQPCAFGFDFRVGTCRVR